MNVINGYKLQGTDFSLVAEVLSLARKKVQSVVTEEYHRLLSLEITQLVDDVAMNYIPRPNVPILHAAQSTLQERMRYAGIGFHIEYNLEAPVYILSDGIDMFLMLQTSNTAIIEAFASSSEELQWFGIQEEDKNIHPETLDTWNRLRAQYGEDISRSSMSSVLSGPVALDTSLLSFESVALRAQERARHAQMNRLLSVYACGKDVLPHRLMACMDQVFLSLLSEESQAEIQGLTGKLAGVLPPITLELIEQSHCQQAPDNC